MSENSSTEDYDVVLLVEQALTAQDAAQVHSLHEGLDEPVTYHVLLPLEDAAARIEAAMGSLTAGDMLASPTMPMSEVDLEAVRKDCQDRSHAELAQTLEALRKQRRDRRAARSSATRRSTRWPPRSPRSTAARRSSSPARTSSPSSSTSTGPPRPAATSASRSCTCSSTRTSTSRPRGTATRASRGSDPPVKLARAGGSAGGGPAVATYAGVLDGRHLWLDRRREPPARSALRDGAGARAPAVRTTRRPGSTCSACPTRPAHEAPSVDAGPPTATPGPGRAPLPPTGPTRVPPDARRAAGGSRCVRDRRRGDAPRCAGSPLRRAAGVDPCSTCCGSTRRPASAVTLPATTHDEPSLARCWRRRRDRRSADVGVAPCSTARHRPAAVPSGAGAQRPRRPRPRVLLPTLLARRPRRPRPVALAPSGAARAPRIDRDGELVDR